MSFSFLFCLHALLAVPYGLGLLLMPGKIIGLFSKEVLTPVGLDIIRLFGASLLFIALITAEASFFHDIEMQRIVARSLFVYTLIGFLSLLYSQLSKRWNQWGWLNILSYLIFVIGYGDLLWLRSTT